MLITDLNYLEPISAELRILGSAGVMVTADAIAYGSNTYTYGSIKNRAKALPNGGAIAIGRGFALADGEDPNADVTVAGEGDLVVGRSFSTPNNGQSIDVAHGFVVAIDLPNR